MAKSIRLAMLEFSLALLPSTLFLLIYTSHYGSPTAVIPSHLRIVAALCLSMMALRLLVAVFSNRRIARASIALVTAIATCVLILYYVAVVVGLESWGRVVTWDMFAVYLAQSAELLQVLQISTGALLTALLCFFAGVVFVHVWLQENLDWPSRLLTVARGPLLVALALSAQAPLLITVLNTIVIGNITEGEPFAMSFNPEQIYERAQNTAVDGSTKLDLEARAARLSYVSAPPSHKRNVILIVADALRADRAASMSHERNTMPRLRARFGSESSSHRAVLYSVCAESYCGLMGLARSRYVHQFSNEAITLQQVLSQNGYKTSLILSGDHTNFYGLARAFGPVDHYWDSSFSDGYVNDDRDVLKQISALSKWKRAPTFLQIHLMSSHALGLRLAAFEKYHPAENYARPAPLRAGFSQQSFANYYDNGVLQLDWVIGAITAELRAKGYLEDALMVITSDHGELLGEHGLYGHANALLQPAIRVPLILTRYGYEPSKDTFASWGSQVDIAPTILAEIGVPAPEGWSGQPLQHASGREAIFFQQGAEAGLLDTSDPEHLWKFWVDYKNNQHYLFDVTRDPKETVNLTETASSTKTPDWLLKLLPAANTVFH